MSLHQNKNLGLGIFAGALTGVFWGLPFIAPVLLTGFGPLEIAFGRFLFFGLISALFMKRAYVVWSGLRFKERMRVVGLSALGFWFYSMVLFWSVAQTSGVIGSLVLGLLPITIPLFSPGKRMGGAKLWFGLTSILLGLFCLFLFPAIQSGSSIAEGLNVGTAGLFLCLALWTTFAIQNSIFLQARPEINRKDFASLMGVISLFCIAPFFFYQVDLSELLGRADLNLYLLYSMALGFGASWFANWLWNICAFHCPPEIGGTLLVFETLFGLIYSFVIGARFPRPHECLAIVLCIVGVLLAVRAQVLSQVPAPQRHPD